MKKLLKRSLWLYLALLLLEGACRKWIFPGFADVFLLIRDPVMLGIYALAMAAGVFPRNAFVSALGALAVGSALLSLLAGQSNVAVIIYGIRTNYLHIGLAWVIARVFDRRDVEKMGLVLLFFAIPSVTVMVLQFYSPRDAWINLGVGGSEGGTIYGGGGRNRPPGLFAFISGSMVYFPIAAAFFFHFVTTIKKGWAWWMIVVSGLCIVLALPISISRGAAISTGFVALVFAFAQARVGLLNARFLRTVAAGIALMVGLSFVPAFDEGIAAFSDRWETSSKEVEGEIWESLGGRVAAGFTEPFLVMLHAPFFGHGIGVGTNVGAKILTGNMGFLLGENEWERTFMELGPLLGLGFVGFRIILSVHLLRLGWRALKTRRDILPLTLWGGVVPTTLLHQWGPATLLGFAVIGAGLILASVNYVEDDDSSDDSRSDRPDKEDPDDDGENNAPPPDDPPPPPTEHELRRRRMRGLA